eukprot:m51a1_g2200 hypothetical protein (124) ;mRNA; r:153884-155260
MAHVTLANALLLLTHSMPLTIAQLGTAVPSQPQAPHAAPGGAGREQSGGERGRAAGVAVAALARAGALDAGAKGAVKDCVLGGSAQGARAVACAVEAFQSDGDADELADSLVRVARLHGHPCQ